MEIELFFCHINEIFEIFPFLADNFYENDAIEIWNCMLRAGNGKMRIRELGSWEARRCIHILITKKRIRCCKMFPVAFFCILRTLAVSRDKRKISIHLCMLCVALTKMHIFATRDEFVGPDRHGRVDAPQRNSVSSFSHSIRRKSWAYLLMESSIFPLWFSFFNSFHAHFVEWALSLF